MKGTQDGRFRVSSWPSQWNGRGPKPRLFVDRRIAIWLPWPVNVLCRIFGHRPRRVNSELSHATWTECARCLRRPMQWATIASTKPEHLQHSANLTAYETTPRWVNFPSYQAFLKAVEQGRQVGWPGQLPAGTEDQRSEECISLEVRFRKSHGILGGAIRLDGPGAGTPIDWHIYLGPLAVYGSFEQLGKRLANRLKLGTSRELSLEWTRHSGGGSVVQWRLWVDPNRGARLGWRDVYVQPGATLSRIVRGKPTYERTVVHRSEPAVLRLPEGEIPIQVRLEARHDGYTRRKKVRTTFSVDCRCETGYEVDDGRHNDWKGGTIGWSVPITDPRDITNGVWKVRAVTESATQLLVERARNAGPDYVPPAPVNRKDTTA